MFLLFEKNYTKEYEKKWKESPYFYGDAEKMLTLLSEYTLPDFFDYFNSLSGSHKEIVKSIIQPYLNKAGELKRSIRYKVSVRTLIAQICTKIPEKELHPKERLFAIFKVVKNHTHEDINAIYQNQNKGRLELVDTNCLNKMIILLHYARKSEHLTLFSCLPNDVALYICQLMLLHTESLENNSVYRLLLGLLEGYCGFNRSIPAHFERGYAEQISGLLAEHQVYI